MTVDTGMTFGGMRILFEVEEDLFGVGERSEELRVQDMVDKFRKIFWNELVLPRLNGIGFIGRPFLTPEGLMLTGLDIRDEFEEKEASMTD